MTNTEYSESWKSVRSNTLQSDRVQFQPGDITKECGVFSVHHYAHRLPHNIFIRAGTAFPECRTCHEKVRFNPLDLRSCELEDDHDFSEQARAATISRTG